MATALPLSVMEESLQGFKYVRVLGPLFAPLRTVGMERDSAGHRQLFYDPYATLMLLDFFNPTALCRGQDDQIDAEHDDLRAAALRRNPEIEPGMTLVAGMGLRKKRLAPIWTGRREDVHNPMIEQGANLVFGLSR